MGRDLERALWRMYAPHKVKARRQRLPAQLPESGIKDVGVIGVDSGWEIYVAGNGGIKTEVAQFFVKVKTAEEVLEVTGAFLQLYREGGLVPGAHGALHRPRGPGLRQKKVLEDHANRKALWARLQARWRASRPWFEGEKARVDARQFIPIARGLKPPPSILKAKNPPSPLLTSATSYRYSNDTVEIHLPLEDIPVLGARRVTRAEGPGGGRVPHRHGRGVCPADRCPHKGGPLSQGIVFGRRRGLPAATGPSACATARPRRPTRLHAQLPGRWKTAPCPGRRRAGPPRPDRNPPAGRAALRAAVA